MELERTRVDLERAEVELERAEVDLESPWVELEKPSLDLYRIQSCALCCLYLERICYREREPKNHARGGPVRGKPR